MSVANVIIYSFETIQLISSKFNATLDDDTISKLLDIKKHNKFIKRKSPLRLKYQIDQSTAIAWRKDRECKSNLPPDERLINALLYNLNKLSVKNYDIIFDELHKIYAVHNEENSIIGLNDLYVKTIFTKAMAEQNYSELYAQLIADMNSKKIISGVNLCELITDICNQFYNEHVGEMTQAISSNIPYDQLCELFAKKTKFVGGFVFIANLFKYKMLDFEIVKIYFQGLLQYTLNSPPEYSEKYIDTIISIIMNCGQEMDAKHPESFKTDFMSCIYSLKDNKTIVKQKYQFKLADITDLYENEWVDINNWVNSKKI